MIGVLVSGEGSNLQALLDAGLPVCAVASSRDGVRALDRAAAAGVAADAFPLDGFADREQRDTTMANWLQERGVRFVVCAGYMHLLTPAFLDRFPSRIVNVHPSLLPEFPGARAIDDALAAGVERTGVTVHFVDEGLDTGDVIRQEPVPVQPVDTLVDRIHAVEHRILPEVVREIVGAAGVTPLTFLGRRSRRVGRRDSTEARPAGWSGASGVSLSRSPAPPGGSERRPGT